MAIKKPDLDEATRKIAERMLGTPPKRHEEMKIGKTKGSKRSANNKGARKPDQQRKT